MIKYPLSSATMRKITSEVSPAFIETVRCTLLLRITAIPLPSLPAKIVPSEHCSIHSIWGLPKPSSSPIVATTFPFRIKSIPVFSDAAIVPSFSSITVRKRLLMVPLCGPYSVICRDGVTSSNPSSPEIAIQRWPAESTVMQRILRPRSLRVNLLSLTHRCFSSMICSPSSVPMYMQSCHFVTVLTTRFSNEYCRKRSVKQVLDNLRSPRREDVNQRFPW